MASVLVDVTGSKNLSVTSKRKRYKSVSSLLPGFRKGNFRRVSMYFLLVEVHVKGRNNLAVTGTRKRHIFDSSLLPGLRRDIFDVFLCIPCFGKFTSREERIWPPLVRTKDAYLTPLCWRVLRRDIFDVLGTGGGRKKTRMS